MSNQDEAALTYVQVKDWFWETANNHALELPHCTACDRFFYYPRPFCPHCWSDLIDWQPVQGIGTVWSFTVVRFGHGNDGANLTLPYVLALIQLPEGVRLMSNVIDCPADDVRSGMPVKICYETRNERVLPLWKPI